MKKIVGILIIIILIVFYIFGILAIILNQETEEKPKEINICKKDIKELSCDNIEYCFNECDKQMIVFWITECRSKFQPYLIHCLNEIENKTGER